MKLKRPISIFLMIFVILIFCTSCFNTDTRISYYIYSVSAGSTPDFKTFTSKNDVAQFSFEYKSNYKIDKGNTYISKEYTSVKKEYAGMPYTSCYVHLIGPNDTRLTLMIFPDTENKDVFTDAQSRVDYILERWNRFQDVEILENTNVIISGIQGYYLADKETDITRGLVGMYKGQKFSSPPKCICREVNLDYNNQIWVIMIDSMESVADSDKPDFDYLLKTFKIID